MSRLPVGSSAKIMLGVLTSALATATLWRCPPLSSFGLCITRSPSPTSSSTFFAFLLRSSFFTPAYTNGSATFSNAEYLGSKLNVWKTKPISLFLISANWLSESLATSGPFRQYLPADGVSRQPRIFINVDFPDPEGPIKATYSFFLMFRLTPLRAFTTSSPILYHLVNFSISMIFSDMIQM